MDWFRYSFSRVLFSVLLNGFTMNAAQIAPVGPEDVFLMSSEERPYPLFEQTEKALNDGGKWDELCRTQDMKNIRLVIIRGLEMLSADNVTLKTIIRSIINDVFHNHVAIRVLCRQYMHAFLEQNDPTINAEIQNKFDTIVKAVLKHSYFFKNLTKYLICSLLETALCS